MGHRNEWHTFYPQGGDYRQETEKKIYDFVREWKMLWLDCTQGLQQGSPIGMAVQGELVAIFLFLNRLIIQEKKQKWKKRNNKTTTTKNPHPNPTAIYIWNIN